AGHLGARPPRHLRQLRQRRPGAAAVHLWRRGPPHAPQRPALQRQTLQVRHRGRGQGVSRLCPPAARPEGLGADRRRCPVLGRGARAVTGVPEIRITHVGGPTTLLEIGELRLLTDPTFDAPGRRYTFGWGSAWHKTTGPAVPP